MFSRSFTLNFLPHLHITQNFKNLKNMKNMKKFQPQNFKNVKVPFDSESFPDSKYVKLLKKFEKKIKKKFHIGGGVPA